VTSTEPISALTHVDRDLVAGLQAIARERPLEVISLGAGVQSTTLALMATEGALRPLPDVAIFADTGWEPRAVYEHLDRLETAVPFPVLRVNEGNIHADLIGDSGRYVAIPFHTQVDPGPCTRCEQTGRVPDESRPGETKTCWRCRGTGTDLGEGVGRRQCTHEYKLKPIRRALRELLGAAAPKYLRVPRGRSAVQWIGFSVDEIGRVNPRKDTGGRLYLEARYPLLEDGVMMSRTDCSRWLRARGWSARKSACIGCPFHGNEMWRNLRDQHPDEWQQAVEIDRAIRHGAAGGAVDTKRPITAYLHRDRLPLDEVNVDRVTRAEWKRRQLTTLDAGDQLVDDELEHGRSCSPYGCEDGEEVTA
jgi:hypothetical protein